MSDTEPSPRPWSVHYGAEIWDANGNMVYNLNGFNRGKKDEANAALIVAAVNEREHLRAQLAETVSEALAIREERDRLRNLVRRLVNQFGNLTSYDDDAAILREARAAIGEDKP